MESLDFNAMTELYDETRIFDRRCFDSAVDYMVNRYPPRLYPRLLEPGIGTGRIAIPLAERGYQVWGVDIAGEMLIVLQKNMAHSGKPLPIYAIQADVLELPFRNGEFDIIIVAHLFYFIQQWQKAVNEILRIIKPGNPLILMHTGSGTEVPFLNTRYKELCAGQGYVVPDIGVKSTKEVAEYAAGLGCKVESIRDRWQWTSRLRLDQAFYYLKARAYSFTTFAPDDVHTIAMDNLENQLKSQFSSLETEIEVPNRIYIIVITR